MKHQTSVSYKELMLALYQLCIDKRTGTMFIATDDNHSIQFMLRNGDIVACRAGIKKGYEVIEWIKTIAAGRYSFAKDFLGDNKSASLSVRTNTLLKELGIQALSLQALTDAELSAAKILIEEELTNIIGPIASIICEDCFDDVKECTFSDLITFVDEVTLEVEETKREQFKKQLMVKLRPETQSEASL